MNIDSLPDYILYPSEDRDAFLHLATQLHDDYDPQCEDELQIFNEILIASWLRKRYETVRTALYSSKYGLAQNEPNSPRIQVILDSIRRFQIEVELQKRQVSSLRRQFRNVRAGFPVLRNAMNTEMTFEASLKEARRVLAPAA